MSECKEIDEALRRLGQKIDGYERALNNLDNRLNDLAKKQAQCCKDNNRNNQNNRPVDLTAIYKRLANLEGHVIKVSNYINRVENAIQSVNKIIENLFD